MKDEEKTVEELMDHLDELIEADLVEHENGVRPSVEVDHEVEVLLEDVSKSVKRMRSLAQ